METRTTIPILANVLIEAHEDGTVSVIGTDLDASVTRTCRAAVTGKGATTVAGRLLADMLARWPKGAEVAFLHDGTTLDIRAGSRRAAKLLTLPDTDFPRLDTGEPGATVTAPAADWAHWLGTAQTCVSTEETRYYLNGVHIMHQTGKGLRFCATDGHRLAMLHVEDATIEGALPETGVILPRKSVALMLAMAKAGAADLTLALNNAATKFAFGRDGWRIGSKLVAGTFPDADRVAPAPGNTFFTLDREELLDAAKAAAAVSAERSRAVKLTFANGTLALLCTSPDSGESRAEIDAHGPEEWVDSHETGVNGRYLADTLRAMSCDTIRWHQADAGSPILLLPGSGATDDKRVIMPMRM